AFGLFIALERSLVFPDFQDRKAGGTCNLVQRGEAQVAALLATCIAVSLEQRRTGIDCVRHDLDVGGEIDRTVLGMSRLCECCRQNCIGEDNPKDWTHANSPKGLRCASVPRVRRAMGTAPL